MKKRVNESPEHKEKREIAIIEIDNLQDLDGVRVPGGACNKVTPGRVDLAALQAINGIILR